MLEWNRIQEALVIAKELSSKAPADLFILEILDKIFLASGEEKRTGPLLQIAYEFSQTKEVALEYYFFLCRSLKTKDLGDFAMKAYKNFREDRFLFFLLTALEIRFLGAAHDSKKIRQRQLLFIEPLCKNLHLRRSEESALVLRIARFTDAYELISTFPLNSGLDPTGEEIYLAKIGLYEQQGNTSDLIELFNRRIVTHGSMEWPLWDKFLRSLVENNVPRGENVRSLLNNLNEFVDKHTQSITKIFLEIILEDDDALITEIQRYLKIHAGKEIIMPDLWWLIQVGQVRVLKALKSIKHLEISASNEGVSDDSKFLVRRLMSLYPGVSLSSQKTLAKELMELAYKLVDEYANGERNTTFALLEAASLCRQFLDFEPDDYASRLLLVLIYTLLGCSKLAYSAFLELDIKNLQLYNLSYLVTDHLEILRNPQARAFYEHSLRTHNETRINCSSILHKIVTRDMFSSLVQYYQLVERLQGSISAVACKYGIIRIMFLEDNLENISFFLRESALEEILDNLFSQVIVDNRDLEIYDASNYAVSLKEIINNSLACFGIADAAVIAFLALFCKSILELQPFSFISAIANLLNKTELWKNKDLEKKFLLSFITRLENIEFQYYEAGTFWKFMNDIVVEMELYFSFLKLDPEKHTENPYESYHSLFRMYYVFRALALFILFFIKGKGLSTTRQEEWVIELSILKDRIIGNLHNISSYCKESLLHTKELRAPKDCGCLFYNLLEEWESALQDYIFLSEKTIGMLQEIACYRVPKT